MIPGARIISVGVRWSVALLSEIQLTVRVVGKIVKLERTFWKELQLKTFQLYDVSNYMHAELQHQNDNLESKELLEDRNHQLLSTFSD